MERIIMNRLEFMRQLESLLQNISPAEREEALQYYNDYFNDAGVENEQDVIEALGNPAKVAENIKRDLYGSGYGDSPFQKPSAKDRAVAEYSGAQKEEELNQQGIGQQSGFDGSSFGNMGFGGSQESYQNNAYQYNSYQGGYDNSGYGGSSAGTVPMEKKTSTGMTVLLVILCIIAAPIAISAAGGLVSFLLGLVVAWFTLILTFGITAVVLLLIMLFLVGFGAVALFVHPIGGVGMIGGGLFCGGLGLLFLMLTVAMAGKATPAMIGGLIGFFRRLFGGRRKMA